jgi:hypothetical protein
MSKQATKSVSKKEATAPAKGTLASVVSVAKGKTAAKPAPVVAKAKAAAPIKTAVRNLHIITDIARPQSGPRLFAHTFAALNTLGMFGKDRPAVLRSAVQSFVGATAIKYHVRTKGTMVEQGDRLRLTEPGVTFFKSREFDTKLAAGYEALFKSGNGEGAQVRKEHIVPVSLAV